MADGRGIESKLPGEKWDTVNNLGRIVLDYFAVKEGDNDIPRLSWVGHFREYSQRVETAKKSSGTARLDALIKDMNRLSVFPPDQPTVDSLTKFFTENNADIHEQGDLATILADMVADALIEEDINQKRYLRALEIVYVDDQGFPRGMRIKYRTDRADWWVASIGTAILKNDVRTQYNAGFLSEDCAQELTKKGKNISKMYVGHTDLLAQIGSSSLAKVLAPLFDKKGYINNNKKALEQFEEIHLLYVDPSQREQAEEAKRHKRERLEKSAVDVKPQQKSPNLLNWVASFFTAADPKKDPAQYLGIKAPHQRKGLRSAAPDLSDPKAKPKPPQKR